MLQTTEDKMIINTSIVMARSKYDFVLSRLCLRIKSTLFKVLKHLSDFLDIKMYC